MARSLNFGTGLQEFVVNGTTTIAFNPTDTEFVSRFQSAVDRMRSLQEEFERGLPSLSDAIEGALDADDDDAVSKTSGTMMEYISGMSDRMRAEVDALFGDGVADGVFPGGMSLYSLSDGYPVWVNFLEAVADVISEAFEAERGKADPRVAASSKKYKAMLAKYKTRGK